MFATDAQMEATAELIARVAHTGQLDKAGEPYIGHPARVAGRFEAHEFRERATGWLHDVAEDTDMTLEDLRRVVSPTVVSAVDALTHRKGEPRADYYARVLQSPLALRVKAADLDDNADPRRLAALDEPTRVRLEAKYRNAREALGLVV